MNYNNNINKNNNDKFDIILSELKWIGISIYLRLIRSSFFARHQSYQIHFHISKVIVLNLLALKFKSSM